MTTSTTNRPRRREKRVNLVESYTHMQTQAEVIWNQAQLRESEQERRTYITRRLHEELMDNLTAQLEEILDIRCTRLFEELGKCTTDERAVDVIGMFLVPPELRTEAKKSAYPLV